MSQRSHNDIQCHWFIEGRKRERKTSRWHREKAALQMSIAEAFTHKVGGKDQLCRSFCNPSEIHYERYLSTLCFTHVFTSPAPCVVQVKREAFWEAIFVVLGSNLMLLLNAVWRSWGKDGGQRGGSQGVEEGWGTQVPLGFNFENIPSSSIWASLDWEIWVSSQLCNSA